MEQFPIGRRRSSIAAEKPTPFGVEVTVLHAENVPQKPVLAIRAGDTLRHVDLNVNAPFHVPVRDFKDGGSVNVSLYQQLGTQQILDVDEPESICSVPVRMQDGGFSQVKLRVRRGRPVPSSNLIGSPADSDDYLGTHQLEAHIQRLFELVLKTQPADPYQCMIEELRKIKERDIVARGPRPAKVPNAPCSEPPAKQRRPSALKSRSKLSSCAVLQDLPLLHDQSATQPTRDLTNRETARKVMRLVFQRFCKLTMLQSTSMRWGLGGKDENRAFGLAASYLLRRLVFEACSQMPSFCRTTDLQTRLAGFYRPSNPDFGLASEETSDLLELRAEAKALSHLLRVEAFRKAADEKARTERAERKSTEELVAAEAEKVAAEDEDITIAYESSASQRAQIIADVKTALEKKHSDEKVGAEAAKIAAEERAFVRRRAAEERMKMDADARGVAERRAAGQKAAAENANKADEERAILERKAAEERRVLEEKAAAERAVVEKRAAEERAIAEARKAVEEKAALEKKIAEEEAAAKEQRERTRGLLVAAPEVMDAELAKSRPPSEET